MAQPQKQKMVDQVARLLASKKGKKKASLPMNYGKKR